MTETRSRNGLRVDGQVFEITKAVTFEAAHFLAAAPEGHRYRNVHGHSFRLEATVAGRVKPGEEWVEDLGTVTDALEAVAGELDHRLLNEVEGLDVPTLERLCVWAANALKPRLPGLVAVTLSRPSLDERCTLKLG